MPKLSLIVPVLANQQNIEQYINGIASSTQSDAEIIVVNVGCADFGLQTKAIVAQHNDRIKLIDSNVASVDKAVQLGIKNATGNYIAFVGGESVQSNSVALFEKVINNAYITHSNDTDSAKSDISASLQDIAINNYVVTIRSLQQQIDNIKASKTYKVGRLALFVPRLLRKILRNLKYTLQHGVKCKSKRRRLDSKGNKMLQQNQPLVSIVVPMYNSAPYLRQCIDSLLQQTYTNIEIILVDDGSKDNTCEIVNQYISQDKRITLLHQQHKYAGVARNLGFEHCKGKYVLFLDSDDFFDSQFVKTMVVRAEASNADIVVCGAQTYDQLLDRYFPMDWTISQSQLPAKAVFNGRQMGQYVLTTFLGWAWDKLYNADFVRRNQLYFQDLRSSNDLYFTFNSLLLADSITVVDKVLVTQRRNHNMSISQTRQFSYNNCFFAADKLYETWKACKYWDEKLQRAFCNWVVNFFVWHYKTLPQNIQADMVEDMRKYLDKYGVFDHQASYYFMQNDYQELLRILSKNK